MLLSNGRWLIIVAADKPACSNTYDVHFGIQSEHLRTVTIVTCVDNDKSTCFNTY